MKGTVIAIDGPAGSGKSTVARAVARRLGLAHLDTGAMYRSVAVAALRDGVDTTDLDAVAALAKRTEIVVGPEGVFVDGVDATEAIRTEEVTKAVTAVASNAKVREVMVERQRGWIAANNGGVLEGRDIGTVVCPDATLKVYLVADPEVRAQRRAAEHGDAVAQDMRRRDQADSTRNVSPLMRADDAVEIDTTHLSIDGVVDVVMGLVP
ncbi:MAG TPA: (d)CMP kinase [Acidimicrobiales bacterium]|nr:(d)CMP kinase [Acidimicrobiales bacterium]